MYGGVELLVGAVDEEVQSSRLRCAARNFLSKILTKVIANKLNLTAHELIHPNQAGFIPKRQISDQEPLRTPGKVTYQKADLRA